MKITKIKSRHSNDFWADFKCEFCNHEAKNVSCYEDANFRNNVIPAMRCKECGRATEVDTKIRYVAIHQFVLIVMTPRREGTWKAYVTPVPGLNHSMEAEKYWKQDGCALEERHARAFFPSMEKVPYAR